MHYLTICAMFKNEHHWMEEWLEYHLHLGVEHFYLVNDDRGEKRELSENILAPYVRKGRVTTVHNHFDDGLCHLAHWHGEMAKRFGESTKWMGFLDMDEYILPKKSDDLRILLEDYEDYDALAMFWVVFGSNGYRQNPPGQINHYFYRSPPDFRINRFVKCFVQPKFLDYDNVAYPHWYPTTRTPTVDPYYRVVDRADPDNRSEDIVRINHYTLRSHEWYFKVKSKQDALSVQMRNRHCWHLHDCNDIYDDEISVRFGHVVRELETNERNR